jgi:S1-C subfamily serine protease
MKSLGRRIALGLGFLLVGAAGAGIALGITAALGDLGTTTVTSSEVIEAPATNTSSSSSFATNGKALSIPEIYERTAPGVVQITSTQRVSSGQQLNPFFQVPSQSVEALGSGFVIDKQGDIVTNYHVIQGASPSSIKVEFSNNVTTSAKVVGTDQSTDLAVLRVNVSPSALTPLTLGDSSSVEVGDSVVAIGNPFGLDRSITAGIVSAIYNVGDCSPTCPLVSTNNFPIAAIQTDAAINHGNSGGPLIDSQGQVIGVNTSIETGSNGTSSSSQGNVGVGFAIQSNTVKQVVAQILRTGTATHAYLGISVQPITPELTSHYSLPVSQGILVADVSKGTGAAKAGLKAGTRQVTVAGTTYTIGGDIIVGIDGQSIGSDTGKLYDIIAAHKPGDKLSLTIYRNESGTYKKINVTVTLGSRP